MWTRFNVTFEFLTKLCGGVPADPEMVKRWIAARAPKNKPPQSKGLDEIAEEVLASVPEEAEPTLHCFQRNAGRLCMEMRTIRGHMKDCAAQISALYSGKVQGEKSFSVKVKNAVYYPPETYWIPVVRTETGEAITEPDGVYDKAIHAMTPRGMISALKTVEYVEGASITFPLTVLTQPSGKLVVSEADLKTLFMYGGSHGYGPERGDGQGRYVATVTQAQEA